jgi:glycosyltransferase involved in cell wall biosynthesis
MVGFTSVGSAPEIGRKRTVLVLAPYLTRRHSGVAQATASIVNALHRRGVVDVQVVGFEFEPGVLRADIPTSVIAEPPARRLVWRVGRLFTIGGIQRALSARPLPHADVVYTQSLEMGLAYRRLNPSTPIVAHLGHVLAGREAREDSDLRQPWRRLDVALADRLERAVYSSPRWHHVVSTPLVAKARCEHFGLAADFFLVQPLCVDIERFSNRAARAETRTRLGIRDDECVIVSVARMVRWKNLDWLIRALDTLPEAAHLVLVGDGVERPALEAAVPPRLRDRVHFTGRCDPVPLLAAGDVFALPSAIESFGIAYAEAMAMGLPCIGLRYEPPLHLSSAEDVVGPGTSGFVVGNETELQKVLRDLCNDASMRIRAGNAARARALSLFSEDAYASFVEELVAH